MRVEQSKVNVQRSGDFEETEFKIKASSKAFDILSSKLYSDPELAIIRELSTNAWDAHVEAGTENKPFEVHLPNKMQTFFSIRDYGTGMSHRDIMQLYTTYFESTKTETNEQVGCLGLGSKSPFSYTDNFSVTSWFQGKKRVYSMFKGEEGFPKVALMQTIDSDEPSGLEVKFACKLQDTEDFLEKAKRVYRKFPILPIFHGSSKFVVEERKVLTKGLGWKIYKKNGGPENSYAIMGCIGYPLHSFHLKGDAADLIRNVSIDIDFPIGSLEIAANREELQYSDFTKEALEKRIDTVCEEIAERIEDRFENCTSLWQAQCLYEELFGNWRSPFNHLESTVGQRLRWKGKVIAWQKGNNWPLQSVASAIQYRLTQNKNDDYIVRRTNDVYQITPERKTILMIDDLDIQSGGRIVSWMKENADTVQIVYLVTLHEWNQKREEKLHSILNTNAGDFKRTSALPRPSARRRRRKTSSSTSVTKIPIEARGYTFSEDGTYSYGPTPYAWKKTDIDINQPGVYVPWRKDQAVDDRLGSVSPRDIKRIINCLDFMGKKPDKVFAFKAGYLPRVLKKEPKWVSLFTYAEEELKKFIIQENLEKRIRARLATEKVRDFDKYKMIAAHLKKSSPLKIFVNEVIGAKNTKEKTETAILLGHLLRTKTEPGSLEKEHAKIKTRYPLLKWIGEGYYYNSSNKEKWKETAKYVELIDSRIEDENVR